MTEPVFEQDHNQIVNTIELLLVASNNGAAEMQDWLQRPRGNVWKRFELFYKPFAALFFQTHLTNPMRTRKPELYEKIRVWLSLHDLNNKRVEDGLGLFLEYERELFESGLLSVKR